MGLPHKPRGFKSFQIDDEIQLIFNSLTLIKASLARQIAFHQSSIIVSTKTCCIIFVTDNTNYHVGRRGEQSFRSYSPFHR